MGKALRVSAGIAPPSSLLGESVSGRSVATTLSQWPSPRRMPSSTRIRAMRGSKQDAASPFFSLAAAPLGENGGKAGRPFRPFRASGIAPSVGGATAVFFSLVVRRMKSKAKTRVGKPSDSVESEGIAPLRKPNPRRADPPGFNPLLISSLKPLNVR